MRVLKICVSVILITFLVRMANLNEIWQSIKLANFELILISFSIHGVGHLLSAYRWSILLKAQGFQVSIPYLIRSNLIALFFNNFFPSTVGGDGYRSYDVSKCGVPKLKSLAIVFVERFLGFYALMVFAFFSLSLAGELSIEIKNLWIGSLLMFLLMSYLVWAIFFQGPKVFLYTMIKDRFLNNGLGKKISLLGDAFKPFKGKIQPLVYSMLLSLTLQLNVIFHYYLISEALGFNLSFVKFLVIIPLSLFVQMVPISVNGVGVRESFYVFVLSTIYGVSIEESLAFSWIAYGMNLLLGVIGGLIYAIRKEKAESLYQVN